MPMQFLFKIGLLLKDRGGSDFFLSFPLFILDIRLGPRMKKIKTGYPESSKDCYSKNLKKYIWCIRNHCIASFSELHNATRANKVW